ncbi:MAG: hypothetical protein AAGD07_20955 [Planctomycetota bacterium]
MRTGDIAALGARFRDSPSNAAKGDRVVRLPNTYLKYQADHITVPGIHTDLPLRRSAIDQTVTFLRTGAFAHDIVSGITRVQ